MDRLIHTMIVNDTRNIVITPRLISKRLIAVELLSDPRFVQM